MGAGDKHLDVHIYLVTQLYTNIAIHLFHVLINRHCKLHNVTHLAFELYDTVP